jgi:hypothetical protein
MSMQQIPPVCRNCDYLNSALRYRTDNYSSNELLCPVHPSGPSENDSCFDWDKLTGPNVCKENFRISNFALHNTWARNGYI